MAKEKHEYAIRLLEGIAEGFKADMGRYVNRSVIDNLKENVEGIERAIKVLKADQTLGVYDLMI